jgi:hypothetical protein
VAVVVDVVEAGVVCPTTTPTLHLAGWLSISHLESFMKGKEMRKKERK